MSAKPSYLGMLNAISVAETAAEPLFMAWADTTKDKQLAKTLRFVGMREGEHGVAFAKRMLELGYEVKAPENSGPNKKSMSIVKSKRSDAEKFEALGFGRLGGDTDVFDNMFNDKNIDPVTGGLLGRYIAEERDSGRMLAAECERITAKEAKAAKNKSKKKASKK